MGPSHTRKKGRKYRYYISSCLLQGRKDCAGSISRVPAVELEGAILTVLRKRPDVDTSLDDNDLLRSMVARVEIRKSELGVSIKRQDRPKSVSTIRIPWSKPPFKRRREILLPNASRSEAPPKPIRSDARIRLISAISRGRHWMSEIKSGTIKEVAEIARRERCSVRTVNKTLSLAFLAPSLIKAAIDGSLPRGVGYARLSDLPIEWSRQYQALGLKPLS